MNVIKKVVITSFLFGSIFLLVCLSVAPSATASIAILGYNQTAPSYASIYSTIRGSSLLTPQDMGVAVSIIACIYNPPTGSVRPAQAAIYTEGQIHQLVAVSGEAIISCNTYNPQWITFPLLSNPKLDPNTYYVLVVWAGGLRYNGGTYPRIYYTAGTFPYQGHSLDCNENPAYPIAPDLYDPNNLPTSIPATYNGNPYFDENKILYCIYLNYIPTSSSATVISAHSPVNLLLTDESGNRIGYDPTTNTEINEIPNAAYSGNNSEPQTITLHDIVEQTYNLQLYGTASGPFTVTINNLAGDGSVLGTRTWTGTAAPNQQYSQTFTIYGDGSIVGGGFFAVPEYPMLLTGLFSCLLAYAIFKRLTHKT
jgi:hypothetical protein